MCSLRLGKVTIGVLVCVGVLWLATPAAALTITGQLMTFATGPDNQPDHGSGNISAVFEAAADYWELAILDDVTVTIDYGWADGPGPLAFSFGDSRTGTIIVPNVHDWFVDATPFANEEYTTPELATTNIGGVPLNYALGFTGGVGAAAGFDLLTVLIHEIGHVLASGPNAFPDYIDGDVDVTSPRPLPGLALPVQGGCCHLDVPAGYTGLNPLMFLFTDVSERRFISDADLLFVAQGGEWEQLDRTRFATAPEPGVLSLLTLGAGLAFRRRLQT